MVGPLAYIGGKNRLARKITALFPKHTTYVEPFAGGAQVFFHKSPSTVEVLNDLDGDIVNFFRVCQWHYEELLRYLRYLLVARRVFDLLRAQDPATLTDIQRAGRFFCLQKTSFGGLILRQNYHYHLANPPNYNPARIPEIIEKAHERLQRVQIESLPYEEVLAKYDRPTTLFYRLCARIRAKAHFRLLFGGPGIRSWSPPNAAPSAADISGSGILDHVVAGF
jgi:DNA adenine methylase